MRRGGGEVQNVPLCGERSTSVMSWTSSACLGTIENIARDSPRNMLVQFVDNRKELQVQVMSDK